ncbi:MULTISPECIES: hypothetical protein [unclassified Streptomyces]|uniref:hypothetical protein n=1 Tax=unclassified Streptomyces TaxID=2593676 RepID=UPI002DD7C531|nr:hypothetical protein [Streptomyces sp. NBC_00243]WRZ22893.1 hypothetical protein OHT59_32645 [Streptomyces sp. NBC_00243]
MKDLPVDDTKDDDSKDQARPDPTKSSADPAPGREAPEGGKAPLSEDTGVHRATPVRSAPGAVAREGVGTSADEAVGGAGGTSRGYDPDARRGTHGASSREGTGGTAVRGRPDVSGVRQVPEQDARLIPQDECDKFQLRMRHAVGGFVDGPRDSVAEADEVLEELAARFADAVARRRTKLRTSWHEKTGTGADTEQLRIALRDYREVTERLLRF